MRNRSSRNHSIIASLVGVLVCLCPRLGSQGEARSCDRPQGCCDDPVEDYTAIPHRLPDQLPWTLYDELGNELRLDYGPAECHNACGLSLSAYKIYYNETLVGECPYAGGTNAWLYKKECTGSVEVFTCIKHRSVDDHCAGVPNWVKGTDPMTGEPDATFYDDNCNNAKDWVVNICDCPTLGLYRYWREGPCSTYSGVESAGWEGLSSTPGEEVLESDEDCGRVCGPYTSGCGG
jgi:hypothetical protein